VNVHPTKAEVKFKEPERIYQDVLAAIRMVIIKDSAPQSEEIFFRNRRGEQVIQAAVRAPTLVEEKVHSIFSWTTGKEEGKPRVQDGEGLQWMSEKKRSYAILGQIQGTYIICEGEDHLVIIDQHAAHERILFEKLKKDYETRSITSEKLLIPILVELSAEESYILESAGEALKSVGFEIEPIGEKLFAIQSIPSFIDQGDPKRLAREILDELSLFEKDGRGEEVIHAILVTLACHSAIRGNFILRREEMDKLIELLAPFHPSATCPHGRPIFFFIPLDELKKQFKRK
jgi:DNA mismatch repair protein MutL